MSDERRIGELTATDTLTSNAVFYAQEPMEANPEIADKYITKPKLIEQLGGVTFLPITVNTTLTAVTGKNYLVYNSAVTTKTVTFGGTTVNLFPGKSLNVYYSGTEWTLISNESELAGSGRTTETVKGNADTILAQNQTYVRAVQSSPTTITDSTQTKIIFNSEQSDVYGLYNSATGVYTALVSKNHTISATLETESVAWTIGNLLSLYLDINGAKRLIGFETQQATATYRGRLSATVTAFLFAGDEIYISGYIVRTGSASTASSGGGLCSLTIS